MAQPFRSGDTVTVLRGMHMGECWVVAVYDAHRDEAYIAGWPCTCVSKASTELALFERATDEEHARMVESVRSMRDDRGNRDPRASALATVLDRGGTP